LPDQTEDLLAKLMAMTKLVLLYPDTFKVLLLAAGEALRPMSGEARLDGHSQASLYPGSLEFAADGRAAGRGARLGNADHKAGRSCPAGHN
jgi:hypothetical protein